MSKERIDKEPKNDKTSSRIKGKRNREKIIDQSDFFHEEDVNSLRFKDQSKILAPCFTEMILLLEEIRDVLEQIKSE